MMATMKVKTAFASAMCVASILACTMTWAPSALAAETTAVKVVKVDPKLKYKTVAQGDLQAATDSFMAELIVKFADQGLFNVSLENMSLPEGVSISKTSSMFANAEANHMVFVKTGVKLSDESANEKLLRTPSGAFAYHAVTSTGVPYAVIFTGFTEKEAREATSSVLVAAADTPVHSSSYVAMILNTLVPSAFAKDCLPEDGNSKILQDKAKILNESVGMLAVRTAKEKKLSIATGCVASGLLGAYYATKAGGVVGMGEMAVAIGGVGAAATVEAVKKLFTSDWSGSVAKMGASAKSFEQTVAKTIDQVKSTPVSVAATNAKNSTVKTVGEVLAKHPDVVAELVCGVVASMKGTPLRDMFESIEKKGGLSAAVQKLLKQDKYAKYLDEAAAETAVAVKAEKSAAKAVAASTESSAASAESSAAKASAAKAESTASKSSAKSSSSKVEVAKSEVAPVSASSAAKAESAAEEAAPASFKPADFSPKNVVQFNNNPELKNFLTQAGLKESEAKPVLDSVSKIASGGELGSEDRVSLIMAMSSMKPEQVQSFKTGVFKALESLPTTDTAAAKTMANHKFKIPLYRDKMTVEFKHAELAAQVNSDPTLYPALWKSSLKLKGEERAAVADVVAAAQERGIPVAKIRHATEEAVEACAVPGKK